MTDDVRRLSRRRAVVDILAVTVGSVSVLVSVVLGQGAALLVGAYGLLLGTSTFVVTGCLTKFTGIPIAEVGDRDRSNEEGAVNAYSLSDAVWQTFTGRALESDSDIEEDTGWLIGRLENVLVLTLVVVGEYTALSIIFAAKSWVRREDTASENTTYYLAGTLVNFTYSIAVGISVTWLVTTL